MAKVSDEQIIAALLTKGTVRATAAAVGLSERAIYDRMHTGDFMAAYKAAKADITRQAVFSVNAQLQAAIDTVVDIMTDRENNAAVRLQAARLILDSAGRFAQRLQADENSVTAQIEANLFGPW